MIVYTCITNNYDILRPIKNLPEGWRAICFSDVDFRTKDSPEKIFMYGWEIIHTTIYCRNIKIQPNLWLPPHNRSIWIDANIEYLGDWGDLNIAGFTLMKHPDRFCIYKEGEACIELEKDNPATISNQLKIYKFLGYPENNGLNATGVIIRDNNGENNIFNAYWYGQVKSYSRRDQLSFNYCAWKLNLQFNEIPFLPNCKKHKHNALGHNK